MSDDHQFIAWLQAGPELWPSLITARHDKLAADFNQYTVSVETVAKCANIQRHVNAVWVRDGNGLLTRRDNHYELVTRACPEERGNEGFERKLS